MRLILFEEPSRNHIINTTRLERLNGGGTSIQRREWTGKMVLIFNEDRMPKLRSEDDSFLEHVLLVQHRSRFCTRDEYALEESQPHMFLASSGVEDAVRAHPEAILAWAAKGHRIYQGEEFSVIPLGCNGWL